MKLNTIIVIMLLLQSKIAQSENFIKKVRGSINDINIEWLMIETDNKDYDDVTLLQKKFPSAKIAHENNFLCVLPQVKEIKEKNVLNILNQTICFSSFALDSKRNFLIGAPIKELYEGIQHPITSKEPLLGNDVKLLSKINFYFENFESTILMGEFVSSPQIFCQDYILSQKKNNVKSFSSQTISEQSLIDLCQDLYIASDKENTKLQILDENKKQFIFSRWKKTTKEIL